MGLIGLNGYDLDGCMQILIPAGVLIWRKEDEWNEEP